MNPPPQEFALLGLDSQHFTRADAKSWRGPCPRCGGHRRFLIFTDREWPSWNFTCSGCGASGFADDLNHAVRQPVSPELRKQWAEKNRQEQETRDAYRRQRLQEFSTHELYRELHDRMTDANREWWASQGIATDWQDFFRLGYIPDRQFADGDVLFHSPAYSIPVFDLGWQLVNMQYRLLNPPEGVGKYRQEAGLPAAAFLSRPDQDLSGRVYVVEGAKKAMVLCSRRGLGSPQVVGLPGALSWAGIPPRLTEAAEVFVILDPDAQLAATRLTHTINQAANRQIAYQVGLAAKPDDAWLSYGMHTDEWNWILDKARRVD